ncbi:MAG: DUF502 domain-containing protein [bacterium]|nr:DUF502 domain-containing protein [bacterium]MDD5755821.1 DUF502 domain-containing protein [bacterium]
METKTSFSKFKQYFLSGLAIMFPVFVTLWVLKILFQVSDGFLGGFVNDYLYAEYGYYIPGLGILIMVSLIVLAGYLTNKVFARRLFPEIERWLMKFPLIRSIYPSAKQLSKFIFNESSKAKFSRAALVPWPHQNCYTLGFVMNEEISCERFPKSQKYYTVFVTTVPNPLTGFISFYKEEDTILLDIKVDEALKVIISGGVISPKVFKPQAPAPPPAQ